MLGPQQTALRKDLPEDQRRDLRQGGNWHDTNGIGKVQVGRSGGLVLMGKAAVLKTAG